MARAVVACVLLLALLAAPAAAYKKGNGKRDLKAVVSCLEKLGTYGTFLGHLKNSGFQAILARYLESQPATLLIPNNLAFKRLPRRVTQQMTGPKLIKLIEYHLLLHKFPHGYLKLCQNSAFFDTVYGKYIYKKKSSVKSTVILSPSETADPSSMAVISKPNLCGHAYPTLAVHGLTNVLLPTDVFQTATH